MITIEGLRGNGALWATFRVPEYSVSLIPTDCAIYVSPTYMRINPFAPFECNLPPTMPEQISYPVGLSSYGPVSVSLEVGSLSSIDTSPGEPHPCTHSTVNGGLFYHGSDVSPPPSFTLPYATELNYIVYDDNASKISFMSGRPAKRSYYTAYNRRGSKVAFAARTENSDLWSLTSYVACDWQRQIGTPIPPGTTPATAGQWRHKPISSSFNWTTGPCRSYRNTGVHLSSGVFVEDLDVEYHTDQSYTPAGSVGPFSGRGYMKAYATWHRTHRFISIQALQDAHFRVLVETKSECQWGYWNIDNGLIEGVTPESKVVQWITLLVLEPGLSCAGSIPVDPFDNYCQMAPLRAKTLFCASGATLARSRAVSDVTGLDSNWIENLSQVRGTPDIFTKLLDGRSAVRNGNLEQARKFLCGAYLTYSYAIAPSIRDYHDVNENIGTVSRSITKFRFSNERRRGRVVTTSPVLQVTADLAYYCTLHLQLKDSSCAVIWNALERLGLDPNANNLWDLIPFSFVVDWFTSIGSALDVISAYNSNTLIRDIKNRIETFKVQWPLTEEDLIGAYLTDFSVSTPLVYTWYDRRIYSGLGSVDPFAGQSNDGLSVSQMAQGAALLSNYR